MREEIRIRVLAEAAYITATEGTVRSTAERFGVSKSTVHKDMVDRLPRWNPEMATLVKALLQKNLAERHLRGGDATARRWERVAVSVPVL